MSARYPGLLPLILLLEVACSSAADDAGGTAGSGGTAASAGAPPISAGSSSGGQLATAGSPGLSGGGSAPSGGTPFGGTGTGGSSGAGGSTGGAAGGGGAAAVDGKALYDANCKSCHGEQGTSGMNAPDIIHPVRDYFTWVVRNGRAETTYPKPMEKYGTDRLSDAHLMLIFDYLDLPPQPTTGKALYEDYCANCHGIDGKGGPTQRAITNEVDKVTTLVRAGHNIGKFSMRRDYMPAFPVSDISDAELTLIETYVDSL